MNKSIEQIIGINLTNLLEERGKTQADLASYLGVSVPSVCYWCNGVKMPRMDKIDAICKYFSIDRYQLMEERKELETNAVAHLIKAHPDIFSDPFLINTPLWTTKPKRQLENMRTT